MKKSKSAPVLSRTRSKRSLPEINNRRVRRCQRPRKTKCKFEHIDHEKERAEEQEYLDQLVAKRYEAVQEQAAHIEEKSRDFELRVAFDPTDPIALLKARRHLLANPYKSKHARFQPQVHFYKEERIVPVNYTQQEQIEAHQEEILKTKLLQEKQQARKQIITEKINQDKKERDIEKIKLAERGMRLQRENALAIMQRVAQNKTLLISLAKFDPAATGRVTPEQFKEAIQQLPISPAEADRLVAQLIDGTGLVHYDRLFFLNKPVTKTTPFKPPSIEIPTRHQFAQIKYKQTKHLLRPATGLANFFPDNQRMLTTAKAPADETLSPVRIKRARKAYLNKKQHLTAHLLRIQAMCAHQDQKHIDLQTARISSIQSQQRTYLAPMKRIKMQDIRLANRPKGKKTYPDKNTFKSVLS